MYIEKGIFDVMAGCSINERMDGLLLQNEEYIKMQNKIEEQKCRKQAGSTDPKPFSALFGDDFLLPVL